MPPCILPSICSQKYLISSVWSLVRIFRFQLLSKWSKWNFPQDICLVIKFNDEGKTQKQKFKYLSTDAKKKREIQGKRESSSIFFFPKVGLRKICFYTQRSYLNPFNWWTIDNNRHRSDVYGIEPDVYTEVIRKVVSAICVVES